MGRIATPPAVAGRALVNATMTATGCIETTYAPDARGYGQIGWTANGKSHNRRVHRVVWELLMGSIDDSLTIHHRCRNRLCVNVAHMEQLPLLENSADNAQSLRTHCPNGHAYDDENTDHDGEGHRRCRACRRESMNRWRRANGVPERGPRGPYGKRLP
jgi:hypothetical protein